MKLLGVVSPKAGRTLLYRVSDVAKMYPHWKMIIPDFVEELCAGKVGGGFTYCDMCVCGKGGRWLYVLTVMCVGKVGGGCTYCDMCVCGNGGRWLYVL